MQINDKERVSVLVVSLYELVRSGIEAVLLKTERSLISCIVEKENVEEAISACSEKYFSLIFIDESILKAENLEDVKRLTGNASKSIILCQLFCEEKNTIQLIKQAGVTGYFFRSIETEVFIKDVENLIAGRFLESEGFVMCN